jgi:hypothetical protein
MRQKPADYGPMDTREKREKSTEEVVEPADDWPAPMEPAACYGIFGAFVSAVSADTEADPTGSAP